MNASDFAGERKSTADDRLWCAKMGGPAAQAVLADLLATERCIARLTTERDVVLRDCRLAISQRDECMSDLQGIIHEVGIVYDSITHGNISKANTLAVHVLSEVERLECDTIEERDKRCDQLVEVVRQFGDNESEWSNVCDMGQRAIELASNVGEQLDSMRAKIAQLQLERDTALNEVHRLRAELAKTF